MPTAPTRIPALTCHFRKPARCRRHPRHRVLLPADVALALAGLATARSRRRALLALVIPVAALSALATLGIRLLTNNVGSPLATAATSALTAPLATDLEITTAICAIIAALLLAAPRLPRRLKIVSDPRRSYPVPSGRSRSYGPRP
jgi:hypothetical protein